MLHCMVFLLKSSFATSERPWQIRNFQVIKIYFIAKDLHHTTKTCMTQNTNTLRSVKSQNLIDCKTARQNYFTEEGVNKGGGGANA
jgi:hypothetical protein